FLKVLAFPCLGNL
ncbi:putative membrane protein, partial [Vibrio parahaemolyticus V-223/04]